MIIKPDVNFYSCVLQVRGVANNNNASEARSQGSTVCDLYVPLTQTTCQISRLILVAAKWVVSNSAVLV